MNLNELPPLFDEHGRCMPANLNAPALAQSRRYFGITTPQIDYAAIHARSTEHLGGSGILVDEFARRCENLMHALRADSRTHGISKGVAVPFLLPRAEHADYGEALSQRYIPAVAHAFAQAFPQYSFTDHNKNVMAGQLGIAPGSRHERLLQAMQQGPVVGCYFPCLSEYSLPAALERVQALPEQFLLAGGYDTSAALVGTPGLLQRTDGYPPLLWLAAVQAEKPLVGYYYEAYGYNLTFNRRPHFGQAAEYWNSGLTVLG
ncbi:MAG: hypothetical protein KKG03_04260 [Gammaproteobacteria bacterium]|nr:hypothetical protein [Sideroxydans sp.]MBU3904450.1 hypothetical protein [Gammaproteobacteria bacterium]MBU4046433.1 hypothetical protein [Gammaproteobacteria bacterium]MBU4150846.1 hypothetical protein [Gammaproteobacteria bacterium]